tara:strand:+ start:910 stop:1509 length:600 start_codon:yes stop_codon:yes gene_type:complete
MIVKLKGYIDYFSDEFIDIDVQGIVYRVFTSKKNIEIINGLSSIVTLFVYELIKENERLFFGFIDSEEREIFSDLLTVQGVGGKMAINIMSFLEKKDIINSITSENIKTFSLVSGVGNKLATRIVNELKEKFKKRITEKESFSDKKVNSQFQDLVSCLDNLGYGHKISESTANRVISENNEKKLEELIPIALKYLSKPI